MREACSHEAIRHFEEAQRLSDDSPQALGALGYLLGQTRDRVGLTKSCDGWGIFRKSGTYLPPSWPRFRRAWVKMTKSSHGWKEQYMNGQER